MAPTKCGTAQPGFGTTQPEVITVVAQPGCGTVQTGHSTSQLTVVGTECDTTQADKNTKAAPEFDAAKTDWGTAQENALAQTG